MKATRCLLIIDLQNDFCPGGALPIPEGDQVIPILNKNIVHFQKNHWPIIASRDWHPLNSIHYKINGGTWPVHCLQNTPGRLLP